jgi:hypothetical protein
MNKTQGYHPWGQHQEIFLTPEAQRKEIGIGKIGFVPVNFKQLAVIDENAVKFGEEDICKTTLKDKTIVLLNISGFLEEQPNKDFNIYLISIDVIVDSGRLYVHSYPKNSASIQPEQYYSIDLNEGPAQVNEEAIVVTQCDVGTNVSPSVVLEIHLPFNPDSVKKTGLPEKTPESGLRLRKFETKSVQNAHNLSDDPSNDQCCNSCITQ